MEGLLTIITLSWVSGAMAFVGGLLAYGIRLGESVRVQEGLHALIGFGGGILLAAVVFALLPDGMERLSPFALALLFVAGGLTFCGIDAYLARQGGSKAQFLAMLMDFVPEAMSLGAVFVYNHELGMLLAMFIGVQNLPEGFNAYRELRASGSQASRILITLFGVAFLGPVAAGFGFFVLSDQPEITASIMVFAAGGILYLLFEDIAPQTAMPRYWLPPLGAVGGFLFGMLGSLAIGHG